MATDPDTLKRRYNALLKREAILAKYLDNKLIPEADRDRKVPEYRSLLDALNSVLGMIGDYEQSNILGGFTVAEQGGRRRTA